MGDIPDPVDIARQKAQEGLSNLRIHSDKMQDARRSETAATNELSEAKKKADAALVNYLECIADGSHDIRETVNEAAARYCRKAGYTVHKGQCE